MALQRPLLLVAALLSSAFATTASPAAEEAPILAIVLGVAHADVPVGLARADAIAWLDASAAPFRDAVTDIVVEGGGEIVASWSAAPAAKVLASPSTLARLAEDPRVASVNAVADDVALAGGDVPDEGADAANTGGRQMIQAEEAWALGFRGEGMRIAITGTGIDPSHEAFRRADGSSRIVGWLDFVAKAATPYDDHGHGTFVGASAAGSAEYLDPVHGAFQEAGVAPGADIVAAKFLTSSGSGTLEGALHALNWSFHVGADVSVNGWGTGACSGATATTILQTIRSLTQAGMVSVVTAGASGPSAGTIGAPGCSESAITVGAIAANGAIYSPSGRGPCSDVELPGSPRVCPDLVAKGAMVRSAVPRGSCSLCDPSGYGVLSGVSAPVGSVGGGVALIEQMKRSLTGVGWNTSAHEEEAILKLTALDLGDPGPDSTYGWGLPQLMGVHATLANTTGPVIVGTFSSPATVLRAGEGGPMRFAVSNFGNAAASGRFEVALARPDGSVAMLDARNVTLDLLGHASFSDTFHVGSSTPSGAYTLVGRFAYSWLNETSGEVVHGVVEREASFTVRRVLVDIDVEGIAPSASPLVPQDVRVTFRNVGNDDAASLDVGFTLPDHYVLAHLDGLDPTEPYWYASSPPPDEMGTDPNFRRVTLIFHVGALAAGAEWGFETTLSATRPGTHSFLITVRSCDPVDRCSTQGESLRQTVAPPVP